MERPQLNTIVEVDAQKLKVLFSHENKRIHSAVVPILRDFLSHELGRAVEVVSRYTAWETLYTATDNVFDLVILSHDYHSSDLPATELLKQIKKLDHSIPIVQFNSQGKQPIENLDGVLKFPKTRQELRSLTQFFRGAESVRKRG